MQQIRYAVLGATQFSKEILQFLINHQYIPQAIFTIPQEFKISYAKNRKVKNCNYASLHEMSANLDIPLYEVESPDKTIQHYSDIIQSLELDILLVIGWYYMVPKSVRDLAKEGAWGIHASMLPDYAGGAPLVWSIINGEKQTGVSLFRLDDGVDDGDLIAQQAFDIDEHDSISEVYQKATEHSKTLLASAFKQYPDIDYKAQDKQKIKIYPQRCPDDGEMDLNLSAKELYNFIRAQSAPYPGAFIKTRDGKKLVIEKARIENID